MTNKPYLLALNRIKGTGPRTVMKLLSRWPNLADLFSLSQQAQIEAGLPEKLALAISSFDWRLIDSDLAWANKQDHHLLSREEPDYPALLKEIFDPPTILYGIGDLSALQQTTIAMVGTRNPSVCGKETAFRFAKELALNKCTIVSGLALGIDAEAHSGALAANGRTIAVMGTGIDQIYPRRHLPLADKIREKGLLLTEFPPKTNASAGHFPRRNRIISGLSLITLVVEAAIRSGSLITARLALEQNRDVLAIPGSIHNPQARGCHYLLQQGAKLVTSTKDILEDLGMEDRKANQDYCDLSLATDGIKLVKCVGFDISNVNQIMSRSGLSFEEVSCNLAELELQGIIKAVPGGYTRCISEDSSI